MTNKTNNNEKLIDFTKNLEWFYNREKTIIQSLEEKNLTEYEIQWNAKQLIMSKEYHRIYKNIEFDILQLEIVNDNMLSKYLNGKMKDLVSYARSLTHNSTCPWNNAISFAKNEAVLNLIDFICKYI